MQGKVVSITNYGAFVELEPGIEGLAHISEMSWTRQRPPPVQDRLHRRDHRGRGPQG
ncbi:MAG: S1 RNA-binding domain-containing protein [Gemmatimonadales bacterium]